MCKNPVLYPVYRKGHRGITLTEMVVAVALIGIITAFTIPKLISSNQDASRKAIMRETVNILESILTEGMIKGTLGDTSSRDFFLSRINAIKICNNISKDEGCWDTATQGSKLYEPDEGGFVLSNGAAVVGFSTAGKADGSLEDGFLIDWNGTSGPNQIGQDQLWVNACGIAECNYNATGQSPGTIGPLTQTATLEQQEYIAPNIALYNEIFVDD